MTQAVILLELFQPLPQAQLPGLNGYNSVFTSSIGGTNYVYVLGGFTGAAYWSTVYKATVDTSGNIGTVGGFSTTSQAQLPQGLLAETSFTASIGTSTYVYVLGGQNAGTGQVSTVYKAQMDSNGNITGNFATTSQAQLPRVIAYHTSFTANIGGTNYVYVLGGGTYTSTVYKAAIDTNGNIGTFSTLNQGQLPQNIGYYSASALTINGTNYVYVLGGYNGSTLFSTVYRAAIDTSGNMERSQPLARHNCRKRFKAKPHLP